jgi:hypothetical protein
MCAFVLDDVQLIQLALSQLAKLPNSAKYMIVIPRKTTICQSLIDRSGLSLTVIE